jgi:N-acetylneuraminic acid mutarotase
MTYYISFYLYVFICLIFKVESFTPAGRYSHSSVLVGNKLYFFGGVLQDGFCSNEVFYLDVTQPFNIQVPSWNDLTPNSGMPFKGCWGTVSLLSDINNEQTIYLFGGITDDIATNNDKFVSMIYSFNLNSLKWNIPTVKGMQPERRRQVNSVIDNTGKMYIFGGGADSLIGSATTKTFNEMVIFNTVELSWSISTSPIISSRAGHTATILSNGVIVYIGGFSNEPTSQILDISQITLYDTKSLTWTNTVCCMNVKYKKNNELISYAYYRWQNL